MLTGTVNSLLCLAIMRAVHGFCNSITQPLYFSLICDYFPRDKRSTANAVIQSANYGGIALSSISILIINAIGWRANYVLMGILGVALSIIANFYIKEPGFREKFNVKKK